MTTGRINQVASSYDAPAPDALSRGAGARGRSCRALFFIGRDRSEGPLRAPLAFCAFRILGSGRGLRPRAAGIAPRRARTRDPAFASARAAREGAGRSLPNLANRGSVSLYGHATRETGLARKALRPWGRRMIGAAPPVRCASKEPGGRHTPDTTHARSRTPSPPPQRVPRQTPGGHPKAACRGGSGTV
jgi:hypothetical protein